MTEHTAEWISLKGRAEVIARLLNDYHEDIGAAIERNRFYGDEFDGAEVAEEGAMIALSNMEDVVWGFKEEEE